MDQFCLLQRRPGDPFGSTVVLTSVTRTAEHTVGECFVLVENGKLFFNGRRQRCAQDQSVDTCLDEVRAAAHDLVERMYRASKREGVRRASDVTLTQDYRVVEPVMLFDLLTQASYVPYLKWMRLNAASPAVRAWLTTWHQSAAR